jgi:uncharacterized cupredoxin-like copper-binding protein
MQQQVTNGSELDERTAAPVEGRPAAPPLVGAIDKLRDEVRAQGVSVRRTQQGFAFFAALALVLALVNLVVIAAKLDGGSKTVTRTIAAATAGTGAAAKSAATTKAAAAAPLARNVSVGLGEFFVKPSVAQAAAGKVTFAVRNGGTTTHEFVVIRTSKPAGSLMKGARADESGNVGETGDLQPGASKRLRLNLKPGHYALICNLPGHYAGGQHVDFTVK